jgi:hypothetical protein
MPVTPFLLLAWLACAVAAAGCGSAANTQQPGVVVSGSVSAGPTCPVERPGDPACAPRPAAAQITVTTIARRLVLTATSTAHGQFRFSLRPGQYIVVARALHGAALPRGTPVAVLITQAGDQSLRLRMDTGIR